MSRRRAGCQCQLSIALERLQICATSTCGATNRAAARVWRLPHLETLDVGENRLAALPDELAAMQHLVRVRADGNPLQQPLPEALRRLVVLEPG